MEIRNHTKLLQTILFIYFTFIWLGHCTMYTVEPDCSHKANLPVVPGLGYTILIIRIPVWIPVWPSIFWLVLLCLWFWWRKRVGGAEGQLMWRTHAGLACRRFLSSNGLVVWFSAIWFGSLSFSLFGCVQWLDLMAGVYNHTTSPQHFFHPICYTLHWLCIFNVIFFLLLITILLILLSQWTPTFDIWSLIDTW